MSNHPLRNAVFLTDEAGDAQPALGTVLPSSLGQKAMASSLAVAIASDQSRIGVDGDVTLISVTPTLDTSAYAAGDLLFDLTAVLAAVATAGDTCYVHSLTVIDKDSQAKAMDVYVAQGSTSLGTLNAAPNISDANVVANQMQLLCQIGTGDYVTLSGASIATIKNLGLPLKTSGSTSFYIGAVTQGAPTQTASGIVLLVGVARK